jgi:hypothetical protein
MAKKEKLTKEQEKLAKQIVKQVQSRVKKFKKSCEFKGDVAYLCQIGKRKDLAVDGTVVLVDNGAIHFIEDAKGTYVKCKGKFVPVSEYGDTTAKKYRKVQDHDVLYMFYDGKWHKLFN